MRGAHGLDELEVEQLLNVRHLRVLEQVDHLAVFASHLLRVHHLVPAANLEDSLEELRVVFEVFVLDELLPRAVVGRHHQTAHDGADLLQLLRDSLRLGPEREHVNLVRVLAHVERSLQQPEELALVHVQPERDVLGALDKVHRGVQVGGCGVQRRRRSVLVHGLRGSVVQIVGRGGGGERATAGAVGGLHRRGVHAGIARRLLGVLGRVGRHGSRFGFGRVHRLLDLQDFLRELRAADAVARGEEVADHRTQPRRLRRFRLRVLGELLPGDLQPALALRGVGFGLRARDLGPLRTLRRLVSDGPVAVLVEQAGQLTRRHGGCRGCA